MDLSVFVAWVAGYVQISVVTLIRIMVFIFSLSCLFLYLSLPLSFMVHLFFLFVYNEFSGFDLWFGRVYHSMRHGFLYLWQRDIQIHLELEIYDMVIHTQQHSKSAIDNTYQCRLG